MAGTYDEVVRAVADELGLGVRTGPTGVVFAEPSALNELDWIDTAVVLSGLPSRQARIEIGLEVEGEVAPPVALVLGMSHWTGFDPGGCPISLIAERIDEEGVDLEFRIDIRTNGGQSNMTWRRRIEYFGNPGNVARWQDSLSRRQVARRLVPRNG